DASGNQIEHPTLWEPSKHMVLLPEKVSVQIENRRVAIQCWMYKVESLTGGIIPVFFLDTDCPENAESDRAIAHMLYGGDDSYRFKQEIVLGIGGVRMLRALGFEVKKYHMNEGHAALLTIELLMDFKRDIEEVWDEDLVWDIDRVKELCVFTTHTPVEAGHDRFSYNAYLGILGEVIPLRIMQKLAGKDMLNMTLLGLNLSKYINGVAKKHGEVSKNMFPGYEIHAITNGVHSYTWTSKQMKMVFDQYIPGWANEPELFVRADRIPGEEIWNAHMEAKKHLINYVNGVAGADMDYDTLTIGFARRATSYKRADLIFQDIEQLKRIGQRKIQLIFAGKAHPRDYEGKQLIKKILSHARMLRDYLKIAYLPDYNIDTALRLVSGVDVWLNNPLRPLEASGTSGMKAAHNGVLNFSVLDGWWIEGHIEGVTGWSIGPAPVPNAKLPEASDKTDAADLYFKMEHIIIPLYYSDRDKWTMMMKNAIAKVAYYFNTHRMMRRYVTLAYIR
ncbi:MAG: alpha-glucan family phosphorylase, partial [bacterium]